MVRDRSALPGREVELSMLDDQVRGPAVRGTLAVVTGMAGSGKSALLATLRNRQQQADAEVISVRYSDDLPRWDLFGAQALIAAFREYFERTGDFQLADPLRVATLLCTPDAYQSNRPRASLFLELVKLCAAVRGEKRLVLVADDVHVPPAPELALAPACRAGYGVVAAYRDDGGTSTAPTRLAALADHHVALEPLSHNEADAVLGEFAGMPVDVAVFPALREALGPLYGNPGTLESAVDDLRRRGRLVVVQGQLCLRDRTAPIVLPDGHHFVEQVRSLGDVGPDLVAMVATSAGFAVNDLPAFAAATGRELARCGRAVDHLVRCGVLDSDPMGRLHCPCPAAAAAVLDDLGPRAVQDLHRMLAEHLRSGESEVLPEVSRLADHIALAGDTLPSDPEIVNLLVNAADWLVGTDLERTARRYHAALHHARPGHPARSRILSALLRLLVRIGRYDWLAAVVAEVANGPIDPEQRTELSAAAALAALHTGRPVPTATHAALVGDATSGALELCARWFQTAETIDLDELAAAFAVFAADRTVRRTPTGGRHDDLVEAAVMHDLVTDFQLLLGETYGVPETGPLAAYHRVVTGYFTDWPAALSAVRELELLEPETPVHELSRLLAAGMCLYRHETKRATEWLDSVPETCRFTALRGWVHSGLLFAEGHMDMALKVGWLAYEATPKSHPAGIEWLLTNLIVGALEAGREDWTTLLVAEVENWHWRERSRASRQLFLLMRGLVHSDPTSALAGADVAKQRAGRLELLRACLIVGALPGTPRSWLDEAHEIAKRVGVPMLCDEAKKLMQGRGIALPRTRARREQFSATELRIIELIQQGRTNRQIAIDIRLSQKTVENHVTRLLAKTGCRSRLDLAVTSMEGRLTVAGA